MSPVPTAERFVQRGARGRLPRCAEMSPVSTAERFVQHGARDRVRSSPVELGRACVYVIVRCDTSRAITPGRPRLRSTAASQVAFRICSLLAAWLTVLNQSIVAVSWQSPLV